MRKKLRVGEFKELGFPLAIRLKEGPGPEGQEMFFEALITEFVEPRGLAFGGGESGYLTRFGRGSATEQDRQALGSWFKKRQEVASVEIGPLEDAWYGHD